MQHYPKGHNSGQTQHRRDLGSKSHLPRQSTVDLLGMRECGSSKAVLDMCWAYLRQKAARCDQKRDMISARLSCTLLALYREPTGPYLSHARPPVSNGHIRLCLTLCVGTRLRHVSFSFCVWICFTTFYEA